MSDERTILLVDDDENLLKSLRRFLDLNNYASELALSSQEALEKVRAGGIAVVVTDILMPGMDGVELVKELGRMSPEISCIVMTGHADKYKYIDIVEAGAKDFLAKPFDFEELQAKLERVLQDRDRTFQLKRANEELSKQVRVNTMYSALSRSLIDSMPIEAIAGKVLRSAREFTESEAGYLGVMDPDSQAFSLVASDLEGMACSAGQCGVAASLGDANGWAWIKQGRRPEFDNRLAPDSRFRRLPGGEHFHGRVLAAPVMVGEELLGLIVLADSARDYVEADVDIVQDIAAIFAAAIKRKQGELALEKANARLAGLLEVLSTKFSSAEKLLKRSMSMVEELGKD